MGIALSFGVVSILKSATKTRICDLRVVHDHWGGGIWSHHSPHPTQKYHTLVLFMRSQRVWNSIMQPSQALVFHITSANYVMFVVWNDSSNWKASAVVWDVDTDMNVITCIFKIFFASVLPGFFLIACRDVWNYRRGSYWLVRYMVCAGTNDEIKNEI